MGISTLTPTTFTLTSGKSDYRFWFSGTLRIDRDNEIPGLSFEDDVVVDRLEAFLRKAPTGSSAFVEFFFGATSLGIVEIIEGSLEGFAQIDPVVLIPGDVIVTMKINQVGSGVKGETLTGYVRRQS